MKTKNKKRELNPIADKLGCAACFLLVAATVLLLGYGAYGLFDYLFG